MEHLLLGGTPADDFDYPDVPAGDKLHHLVLYRLSQGASRDRAGANPPLAIGKVMVQSVPRSILCVTVPRTCSIRRRTSPSPCRLLPSLTVKPIPSSRMVMVTVSASSAVR